MGCVAHIPSKRLKTPVIIFGVDLHPGANKNNVFSFLIAHTTEHVGLIHLLPGFSLEDIFARECHPPISHKLCEFLVLMEILG